MEGEVSRLTTQGADESLCPFVCHPEPRSPTVGVPVTPGPLFLLFSPLARLPRTWVLYQIPPPSEPSPASQPMLTLLPMSPSTSKSPTHKNKCLVEQFSAVLICGNSVSSTRLQLLGLCLSSRIPDQAPGWGLHKSVELLKIRRGGCATPL